MTEEIKYFQLKCNCLVISKKEVKVGDTCDTLMEKGCIHSFDRTC